MPVPALSSVRDIAPRCEGYGRPWSSLQGMQRIATRTFVVSSVAFGLIGVLFFLGTLVVEWQETATNIVFAAWGVSGSVVLSSFALSVAGKYLTDDS